MGDLQMMACYLAALEVMTESDTKYTQQFSYVNTFIKWFGKERVYLVGSTNELTKLAHFKDDGDADFLMVSGAYEVDVEQLEFNKDNARYLCIRADAKSQEIGLETVRDKYIAANCLREVKPELFTFLRTVHALLTAPRHCLPENGYVDTVLPVASKVGLAITHYRGLKLDDKIKARMRQNRLRKTRASNEEIANAREERWKGIPVHESDRRILRRLHRLFTHREYVMNHLNFMYGLVVDVVDRQQQPDNDVKKSREEEMANEDANEKDCQSEDTKNENFDFAGTRNTYSEKTHFDFVPALRLNGKLEHMKRWKERAENAYMDNQLVQDIYETDIFVVSRVAPNTSNFETEFCLSFNIAETKLVSSLTPLQRKVFLIMKAFLTGVFEKHHQKYNQDLRLRTYHIKNSLLWFFELNHVLSFEEDTVEIVMIVLRRAIEYLKAKLDSRFLPHYFVGSNLLSDFEEDDFHILGECVHIVLNDPVKSLQSYLEELNERRPCDIEFTEEEVECLLKIPNDGGRSTIVDRLEESLVDLQRGINQGPRDAEMRAPIKEALLDMIRSYLANEKVVVVDTKLFEHINTFFTQGKKYTKEEVNAQMDTFKGFLNGIGIFFPDIKPLIDQFGDGPRLEQFIRGALSGTPLDFTRALDEQLLETIERYLSCPDIEEDDIADELVYKIVGYFSGRKERIVQTYARTQYETGPAKH